MVLDTGLEGKILTSAGDNAFRWRHGERLEDLFEDHCDALRRAGRGGDLAVDGPAGRLTYDELDAAANRVARFLVRGLRVQPGDRVGLLFDDAVDGYICMLAVLKVHAVYVPMDPGFPADRISYIVADAGVRTVLSHSRLAGLVAKRGPEVVYVDQAAMIAAEKSERLTVVDTGAPLDDLCYVIYTSGTTGRPKGVAVSHPSICNFVRVAVETYGYTAADRVYQGLTMAFDFAVEETWVPWLAGATLVPKPRGGNLLGPDLAGYLREQRITALCCVPTLLATLDDVDLPGLRFLLVSGEACPRELADRWHQPGRRFLNVYGPTEATVSATWTLLEPGLPVTIGVPLPTYSVAIIDRQSNRVLPADQTGEIAIAGIGLAEGYLNLPDKTREAFTPDFAGMPGNPSRRIYRTGDLGKINADGQIVHKGRIDTQVKIRGYRIELAEIESVLAEAPGVTQAVVTTYESGPGVVELAGYYRLRRDAGPADPDALHVHLRARLPAYMVPAYLVEVAEIPMTTGGKVDRKSLPPPSGQRHQATRGAHSEPDSGTEKVLADTLAEVLGLDRISAEADFFDELGASSLLMARFIAALPDGTTASMRAIYENRTVRRLAVVVDAATGAARQPGAAGRPGRGAMPAPPESLPLGIPVGKPRYVLCGALQLLVFAGLIGLLALALDAGSGWLTAGHGARDVAERAVVFGVALQAGLAALPIAAKWLLIGRWKPGRITIWSLAYVRFWIVRSLLVASPLALLSIGTPLLNVYLRALGAKVGRGAVIFTGHVPVVTDLLTVGPGTVVRKACYLNGYRARGGVIEIAPVTLGADVFVGEQTVLDIGTGMGDGATLGHSSSLLAGQVVPADACWHGSPARPAPGDYDYRTAGTARCGRLRRSWYAASRLAIFLLIAGPVEAAAGVLLWARPRMLASMPELDSLAGAAVIGGGLLIAGLIAAGTVPRLLTLLLRPGKTYPLFGFHFTVQHLVSRWSNLAPFNLLFGDSVLITRYLKLIGYRLGRVEQTGSNFGTTFHHEIPALSYIGTGTMVSDGLSMMNADFSSSAFQVRPVVVGPGNFLGNDLAFPAGARTGENCLIATKAMIPLAGPVREGVGLLGSPCFEIPRTVQRDTRFDELSAEPERSRRIIAKTRHNLVTIALHLLVRFALLCWLLARRAAARQRPRLAGLGEHHGADLRRPDRSHRPVRARGSRRHRVPPAAAAVLLDLPAAVLAARALLEGAVDRLHADLRRHPVQGGVLAAARRADGAAGVRRRLRDHRAQPHQRRQRHDAQHGLPAPGPLARGRHLYLRPDQHRVALHCRHRRLRPLRGDDGGRRAGRGRCIRDEGFSNPPGRPLAG